MTYQDARPLQLFDLLAREWVLSASIKGVVFNNCDTAVAVTCEDGTISMILTEDENSPNSRVHHAVDTGVQTIRPRKGDIAPVHIVANVQQRTSSVVAHGDKDFLFGTANGQVNIVTPQGDVSSVEAGMQEPVVVVASGPDGSMLSYAAGNDVLICGGKKQKKPFEIQTAEPVVALAFSSDGQALSVAHKTGISVWKVVGKITKLKEYPLEIPAGEICWSADAQWLACTMAAKGFVLINTQNGWSKQFSDFPTPVNSLSFCPAANAIAASGAFRAAAWSLAQIENTNENSGALHSGKPGLVAVDSIAASPNRNLLAVGYANGLLCLTRIGHREEMLLVQDNGVGISILAWSKNGTFLAIGKSDGKVSVVEFPRGMFK